jgi:predicted ABC-type ATPase
VAQRVANGGHGIPNDVIVRRYTAALRNMRHFYLPLADVALIYDNFERGRVLIAERHPHSSLTIRDSKRWRLTEEATK